MKINKQLFEDVLSGKLKGTFVMGNGNTYFSYSLHRNNNKFRDTHPYAINLLSYTPEGRYSEDFTSMLYDIADFIPDTDMKENELTIEIPDGKEIDWEESKKRNKIVLKDKQLTYEEMCGKLFPNLGTYYYVNNHGNISTASSIATPYISNPNSATTEHQLECILAKNKLANVAKYLNDGWKANNGEHIFYLTCCGDFENEVSVDEYYFGEGENLILFKTQKAAQQAIEILGEETIKLALEPLGI